MNKLLLIVLFFLGGTIFLSAQKFNDLKEKQKKNQKELTYTNKILKSVRSKKSSSLSRLKVLQQNIKTREVSVKLYQKEVKNLESTISKADVKIQKLTDKQEKLKKVYSALLVNAYFKGSTYDKWLYIFSSKDFAQAYNRYKYYNQFTEYTKTQLATLTALKDSLSIATEKIKRLKSEKEGLVVREKKAQNLLTEKKKAQQKEIRRLKSQEKDLLARLKVQRKRDRNLEKKIKQLLRKAAKKASKKTPRPTDTKLSKSFASNKGKLPWPTTGFISSDFGEHAHPVLKSVKVRNDGIDITTKKKSICKAIFNGEVSQVLSIPGLNSTVIIKHGVYLSVYANLVKLRVKKGDKITTGQPLGEVATDSDGVSVLKLQIWKNTSRQNPKYWLRRK